VRLKAVHTAVLLVERGVEKLLHTFFLLGAGLHLSMCGVSFLVSGLSF